MKTRSGRNYLWVYRKISKFQKKNKELKTRLDEFIRVGSKYNDTNNKICDLLLSLPSVLENGEIIESNYP